MSSNAAAALSQGKPGNEPSMEEILASIRRIIADDSLGSKKDEPPIGTPVVIDEPKAEPDDSDVLDLAEVATVSSQPTEVMIDDPVSEMDDEELGFDPIPVEVPVMPMPVMVTPPPVVQPAPMQAAPAPINSVGALEERIVSQETGAIVGQAFAALSRTSLMPAAGRSIEDVVVELLRPLLRTWLDDHLPGIVEKLVKVEIERVARGG